MRITVIVIGTRGDVQPYIALGLGLQNAGHAVCLATHTPFAEWIVRSGLGFAPVANPQEAVDSLGGHQALAEKRTSVRFQRHFANSLAPYLYQGIVDAWEASKDADVIIATGLGIIVAYHVAEELGLPLVRASCFPISPSRAYPPYFVPTGLRLGATFNLWSHYLRDQVEWLLLRAPQNQARSNVLHLGPLSLRDPFARLDREHAPLLYGFSPAIFPRPTDWGEWMRVTGYWFLDHHAGWQPPSDLADFIESGPPPVYIGFGSMGNRSPEETAEVVVSALTRSKQRGILLSGWRGLANPASSDDIYFVNDVPHDWLFPRVSAVVHQGGVGTTHFGLRAGKPSIIVPYIADQYFWGQRIVSLGAGPPPLPRKTLSAEGLAEAIRIATTDAGIRRRAAAIGHQIQGERGVENAIAEFHACFDAGPGACDRSHRTGAWRAGLQGNR